MKLTVYGLLLFFAIWPSLAFSAPVGGSITGGVGTISQSGTTTTINQTSQNMALDWQKKKRGVDQPLT